MAQFDSDVTVIGAGLAGLATAVFLAREGKRVTVFEQSSEVGGRARSDRTGDGFVLNLGPHAVYPAGPAFSILRELSLSLRGGTVPYNRYFSTYGGQIHRLPTGLLSLLRTGLLRRSSKLETARFFYRISRIDTAEIQSVPLSRWVEENVSSSDLADFLFAFLRIAGYANSPVEQSAGSYVAQGQLALKGPVLYLDGGWQTLVDGLSEVARSNGVRIETGRRVRLVEVDGPAKRISFDDSMSGEHTTSSVVAATSPSEAYRIIDDESHDVLKKWAADCIPVKMACLDLALNSLPNPEVTNVLGVDSPTYLSVHSELAKLAPERKAVVHVAKYLGPSGSGPNDEEELEGLLDLVQPGWRKVVVHRRFMPALMVSHSLASARNSGVVGRPGPQVPDLEGVYVAGDWVGQEGLLTDGVLSSARSAAEMVLSSHVGASVRPTAIAGTA